MQIKDLFDKAENGTLNYEQFEEAVKSSGAKFVDLSDGAYVSKKKYEDELNAKTQEIDTLNGTITTRDSDLEALKKQLEEAGTDSEKLATLSTDFSNLQTKYTEEVKSYKEQLKRQQYEFAVNNYANAQKFTSNAAKRDFINSMISKGLKMDNNTILGADDFKNGYAKDNEDAFVVEQPQPDNTSKKPEFVSQTQGGEPKPEGNSFVNAFHFTGVRPKE